MRVAGSWTYHHSHVLLAGRHSEASPQFLLQCLHDPLSLCAVQMGNEYEQVSVMGQTIESFLFPQQPYRQSAHSLIGLSTVDTESPQQFHLLLTAVGCRDSYVLA